MRCCHRASCWPVREPAASKSLTYCGRGMLPTTVVGKSGSDGAMNRPLGTAGDGDGSKGGERFLKKSSQPEAPARACLLRAKETPGARSGDTRGIVTP